MDCKRKEKIIFACAIRDCEQYITKVYNNIVNLAKLFSEYKIIFIESDSKDATVHALLNLKHYDHNVEFVCLGQLQQTINSRTDRIALARNTYLDLVRSNYSDWDLLCMFDADDRSVHKINEENFLDNFNYNDWDMICANQENKYYDLWALRHDYWMPTDLIRMMTIDRPNFISYNDAGNMFSHSRRIHIPKNAGLIKVDSAFGGMAMVKIPSIKNAKCIGHYQDGFPCCEWVPFCKTLNNGEAKIYINSKFINGPGET